MATHEHSVVIERPLEEVWAFLHDPDNDSRWQPSLSESRQLSDGPMEVGTQLVEVRHFLGRRLETVYEVTEYDPPRRSAVRSTSGPIPVSGSYVLDPADGGTRFTARIETDASGFFKLAEPIFGRFVRREMESNFGHLKDVVEAEAEIANVARA